MPLNETERKEIQDIVLETLREKLSIELTREFGSTYVYAYLKLMREDGTCETISMESIDVADEG